MTQSLDANCPALHCTVNFNLATSTLERIPTSRPTDSNRNPFVLEGTRRCCWYETGSAMNTRHRVQRTVSRSSSPRACHGQPVPCPSVCMVLVLHAAASSRLCVSSLGTLTSGCSVASSGKVTACPILLRLRAACETSLGDFVSFTNFTTARVSSLFRVASHRLVANAADLQCALYRCWASI
jgi:hypothetical protein